MKNINKGLLKITGFNSNGVRVGSDISDDTFKIEVIDVTSPDSGESLISGQTYSVTWDTNNTKRPVTKVNLIYTKNDGSTWNKIVTLPENPGDPINPGTYNWTIPNVSKIKNKSRVKVVLMDAKGITVGSDTSSGNFTIAPAGTQGTQIISKGVMTKGSIILFNSTYTVPVGIPIRVDDNPGGTEDNLKNGMVVKIIGQKFNDSTKGTVEKVEVENEIQGRVLNLDTSVNPPSFQILGQIIYIDDLTVFSDFPGPNNITSMLADQFVEVHGERDANSNIRASRIELLAGPGDPDPGEFEIKGIVTGKTDNVLSIGLLSINTAAAVFEPAGTTIADIKSGDLIEAKGTLNGLILEAAVIQMEDIEDAEFEPAEGDETEIEGFIANFTAHPGTFNVDGKPVQTTSSTRFESGPSEDLIDNIKVEAEGHISGNVLVAEKIKFKRARVKIEAQALTASTLTLATGDNINVVINNLTDIDSATLPMASPNRYEVRGYKDSSGDVIIEEIKDASSGGGARDILQARVESISGDVLTMLSIPVDLSSVPANEFHDDNDIQITKAAFLAAISNGTVVKVRNKDLDGNWDEAELEN